MAKQGHIKMIKSDCKGIYNVTEMSVTLPFTVQYLPRKYCLI